MCHLPLSWQHPPDKETYEQDGLVGVDIRPSYRFRLTILKLLNIFFMNWFVNWGHWKFCSCNAFFLACQIARNVTKSAMQSLWGRESITVKIHLHLRASSSVLPISPPNVRPQAPTCIVPYYTPEGNVSKNHHFHTYQCYWLEPCFYDEADQLSVRFAELVSKERFSP